MRLKQLVFVGLILAALLACASVADAEESVDQQTLEIARLLRCPVCQNLSVADSSSQLAGQMRDIIHKKVEAGESREEILAYFVERYGESVLNYPPSSGFAGLAWWGAAVIPVAGLAFAAIYVRRRLVSDGAPPPSDDPHDEEGEE